MIREHPTVVLVVVIVVALIAYGIWRYNKTHP